MKRIDKLMIVSFFDTDLFLRSSTSAFLEDNLTIAKGIVARLKNTKYF